MERSNLYLRNTYPKKYWAIAKLSLKGVFLLNNIAQLMKLIYTQTWWILLISLNISRNSFHILLLIKCSGFKLEDGTCRTSRAVVKNLPASVGDTGDVGSVPGLGRPPGNGIAARSTVPPWQATVRTVAES